MPAAVYETKHLRLTLANPALAGFLADYYTRNRAFLTPFDPVRGHSFFTEAGQRVLLEEEQLQVTQDQAFRLYLSRGENPTEIIGMIGLSSIVRGAFQSCFLGYKLDGRFLRRGYMSEALEKLVQISFFELGLHRIEGNVMPRNTASLRVLEKAGFQNEGISPKYLNINGV